jgi:hypothetical protein
MQKGRSKGGLFVGVIATGDLSLSARRLCGEAGLLEGGNIGDIAYSRIREVALLPARKNP